MQIGELAADLGVSTKTLRHYERIGLLPAAVRRENGYRDYPPKAVARARQIVALRALDLPLNAIADLLAEEEIELRKSLLTLLDEKRSAMSLEISILQGKLDELDMRLINLLRTPDDRPKSCICALLNEDCACEKKLDEA
ncbi:helix-turn-helix domain-containing protein [Ovoidimarina sediminis]|uniref:helix-turn-helix domain-containing protein n=1 Tax=Ovoidimarina sediminis TaxID=3079856 RepID=UPI002914EDB6|nr:MerR family transcriptional regulator [Rhodophyticola sp. MJ-SS7]MDU8944315.1 MerR family transcriptional regulator [Rhodophyticola sp. MJ-SS7]